MKKLFALLDCNNFYASCERVFDPSLRGSPLVILSNNDGCVIARSQEAKKIGIKMGEPVFKCRHLINRYGIKMRSANFSLYGDMSMRVMQIVSSMLDEIEIYSIDEAFMQLADLEMAEDIRKRVERFTGIPVSIGLGATKVLAKLANKIAKRDGLGVFALDLNQREHLSSVAVADIWGVGRAYAKTLSEHGISTALDLQRANATWIKEKMGINGLRLLKELNGELCFELDCASEPNKTIVSSRSFGQKVSDLEALKQALANFVAIAAFKLRKQNLFASEMQIFLKTDEGSRINSGTMDFASFYSPDLISFSHSLLEEIYEPATFYKKAGLVLSGLNSAADQQLSLFVPSILDEKKKGVLRLVDKANKYWGERTLFWAVMGSFSGAKPAKWRPAQQFRSPSYTTQWSDLPLVKG